MNHNDTTLTSSMIEAMLPMFIEEDVVEYVPSQAGMGLESKLVPVIPEIRIQANLLGSSMKKHYSSRKSNDLSALLMNDEKATVEIRFPNGIPLKLLDRLME